MTPEEFQSAIQSLSPMEFERFVQDLLESSKLFKHVTRRDLRGQKDVGIDIEAEDFRTGSPVRCFLQVKKNKLVGNDLVHYTGSVARSLKEQYGDTARMILVIAGNLTNTAKDIARWDHVEIWDAPTLAKLATPDFLDRWFGSKKKVETDGLSAAKAQSFKTALLATQPGHNHWSGYQRLIADILEFLFCPPLENPRYEFSDSDERNRRDMIFENPFGNSGFWAQVRHDYSALYIVVDAKNYKEAVDKDEVLSISHYLKTYGLGMFALLVSRKGASDAAKHATREHWIGGSKMVIHVNDEILIEMLAIKERGGDPGEVMRRLIADFRMSL